MSVKSVVLAASQQTGYVRNANRIALYTIGRLPVRLMVQSVPVFMEALAVVGRARDLPAEVHVAGQPLVLHLFLPTVTVISTYNNYYEVFISFKHTNIEKGRWL